MATLNEKQKHAEYVFSSKNNIKKFFDEIFGGIEYDKFEALLDRVKSVNEELKEEQQEKEKAAELLKKTREAEAKGLFELMKKTNPDYKFEEAQRVIDLAHAPKDAAPKATSTRKSAERIEFTYMVNGQPEKAKRLTNTIKDELQKVKKGASNDEAYLLVAKEDQEAYLEFAIQQPRFSKQLEAMAKHFGLDLEAAKEKVKAEKKN
ncbi:hypothetical protein [Vibrio furnissii]|uniref:hypothetical protein n=1 Tax=Vibrio furnissii TaxID=29494 RepID=UPI001EEA770D|nr:hypothetical protein [Vibrio furnissii]MCG6268596.1 hypothetical protein [Vibrio furnissii]HCE4999467.1 hypothetical protein [Vibrio parahaemolyticus]